MVKLDVADVMDVESDEIETEVVETVEGDVEIDNDAVEDGDEDEDEDEQESGDEVDEAAGQVKQPASAPVADVDPNYDVILEIREIEAECRDFEGEVEDLGDGLKEAKARLQASQGRLRRACAKLRDPAWRPSVNLPAAASVEEAELHDDERTADDPPAETVDEVIEADERTAAWRAQLIGVLDLDVIKGCGKKKQDAIAELCPTVGHLEDRRIQAGRSGDPFCELLPKGVGQDMADEIEELLLESFDAFQAEAAEVEPWEEPAVDDEPASVPFKDRKTEPVANGQAKQPVASPNLSDLFE